MIIDRFGNRIAAMEEAGLVDAKEFRNQLSFTLMGLLSAATKTATQYDKKRNMTNLDKIHNKSGCHDED